MHDPTRLLRALRQDRARGLHVLIVPSRLELTGWLGNHASDLGSVLHLDPYLPLGQADRDMTTAEIREALSPLFGDTAAHVLFLDTSLFHPRDEAVWSEAFRGLNESRARFLGAPGSVVMCLTPRTERLFARDAPDVWSVRSTAVELPTLPRRFPARDPDRIRSDLRELTSDPNVSDAATVVAIRLAIEALLESPGGGPISGVMDFATMLSERPAGMTGTDDFLSEGAAWFLELMGESLEHCSPRDALRCHAWALSLFWGRWSSGVISGREEWLMRAGLGGARSNLVLGNADAAESFLWDAAAYEARAPWLSLSLGGFTTVVPSPSAYGALAEVFASFGQQARAARYASISAEAEGLASERREPGEAPEWVQRLQAWPPLHLRWESAT